jgi:lipopolysaccharide/colanic/teichoic acid biosynthesis glycosyltransferase
MKNYFIQVMNAQVRRMDGGLFSFETEDIDWAWPTIPPISNQRVKRTFDVMLSLMMLTAAAPVMLLIALIVKLDSSGPVFYTQTRVGENRRKRAPGAVEACRRQGAGFGKNFKVIKFRSMRVDAEAAGRPVWCKENDPRITRFGRFLRASHLDELPQLFNILHGDMSLVGPRPERPVFIDEFKRRIPGYMLRHKIKAGITGWAQVNGWRGNTSLEKRIECDLFYISNWSIGFDFRILVLTLFKGFFHRNAY